MAWGYFDTSALIKRYVDESGHREVMRLLHGRECVTSALVGVELRSAVRRRAAEGSMEAERMPDLLKRFGADRAFWAVIEVNHDVLAAAEMLVAAHPLRTLDAIHVASAQLFIDRVGSDAVVFVSADKRQAEVAEAIGMTIKLIA